MQLAQVDISKEWQLSGGDGKGGFTSLASLVTFLLPKVLLLGGIIFFIMVIIVGFGILKGAGSEDAQAKEKTKNYLTYGLVGLSIMFGAYWILQIINYITGGSLKNLGL